MDRLLENQLGRPNNSCERCSLSSTEVLVDDVGIDCRHDDGICGRPWETWGFSFVCVSSSSSSSEGTDDEDVTMTKEMVHEKAQSPPAVLCPYQADGFCRLELPTLR
eukprot:1195692-Prorocentrum_minimum.AAC.3